MKTQSSQFKPQGAKHPYLRLAIACLLTLAMSTFILWRFAGAAADGLAWEQAGNRTLITPSFEAQDPDQAKPIGNFTLPDRNGNEVQLSDFAGVELLIVNLWASDCPPCLEEMPSLVEMDERLSELGNVALLTITTNANWDEVAHVFPQGTDLRILFDPKTDVTQKIFGTTKFPETFILDRQRRIRVRFDGKRAWHSPVMLDYITTFKQ